MRFILGFILSACSAWLVILSILAPSFIHMTVHTQCMTSFVAAFCFQRRYTPVILVALLMFSLVNCWASGAMMEHHPCDSHIRRYNRTVAVIQDDVECTSVLYDAIWIISWLSAYLQVILLFHSTWETLHSVLRAQKHVLPCTLHCILVGVLMCYNLVPLRATLHFAMGPSSTWMHIVAYCAGLHIAHAPRFAWVCCMSLVVACCITLRGCSDVQFPNQHYIDDCVRSFIAVRTCQVCALLSMLLYIYTQRRQVTKWTHRFRHSSKNMNRHCRPANRSSRLRA